MKKFFSNLNVNKKLGITAFALGVIAIFGVNPYDHTYTTVNTKDIAYITEKNANKIDASELADWIIKDKADYKLVDFRSEKEFNDYHIPGALNIKATELEQAGLQKPEKIILYSDNEMNAAESWFLLKAKGYKAAYVLSEGMNGWKEKILFPAAPDEKAKQVSLHFGGTPQTGDKNETAKPTMTLPKLQAPAQNAQSAAPRKKKEGC